MLEKIDKIQELLNVPNVDASTETAIANMKILNLLVDLRAETEQLILSGVSFSEADNKVKTPIHCEVSENGKTPKVNELVSETEVCPTCNDIGWIMCDDGKNLCPDCGCYLG